MKRQGEGEEAEELRLCNYFQFSGPPQQLWDPTFNALLAWEGTPLTHCQQSDGTAFGSTPCTR